MSDEYAYVPNLCEDHHAYKQIMQASTVLKYVLKQAKRQRQFLKHVCL